MLQCTVVKNRTMLFSPGHNIVSIRIRISSFSTLAFVFLLLVTSTAFSISALASRWCKGTGAYTSLSMNIGDRHLVVGLNPALQRTIALKKLAAGSVNRATAAAIGIGGKGQNVVTAAKCLSVHPSISLTQFLGRGSEGDAVVQLLGLTDEALTVRTAAPCRTCITLVDGETSEATEIIEPSGAIDQSEIGALLAAVEHTFSTQKVRGVAIMGSMPPGCPENLYAEIVKRACGRDSKVLLDTLVGLKVIVDTCLAIGCDVAIKINARELCGLAKLPVPRGGEASCAIDATLVREAASAVASSLLLSSGAQQSAALGSSSHVSICVTDGPFPAHCIDLTNMGSAIDIQVPRLSQIANPIGSGDATAAGTLFAWTGAVSGHGLDAVTAAAAVSGVEGSKGITVLAALDARDPGLPIAEAFRFGLACGSASCLTNTNSVFDMNEVLKLWRGISIES